MSDTSRVNSQIIDTINQTQTATMGPQVVLTSGAGKAYQAVAQSAAITVQDAADGLRNMTTLSTTAIGVAFAQLLANPNKQPVGAMTTIESAKAALKDARTEFTEVGTAAGRVLKSFPSG